jgi:hypothetical protein
MAKKKGLASQSARANVATPVPADQLDLPVSIDSAGRYVTLRELMQPGHVTVAAMSSLSPERRADLTAQRVAAQPKYQLAMVGGGMIDKDRAIEEIKSQSEIGRLLIEIEQRVINHLMSTVSH